MNTNTVFPFRFFPIAASITTILVGCTVIGGWIFDVTALQSVLPGAPKMTGNTALGFVLSGLALGLYATTATQDRDQPRPRQLAQVMAGAVCLLALLTLLDYLFGWDLQIDQLLIQDIQGAAQNLIPGRPSPHTALAFAFVGLALLLLRNGDAPYHHIALLLTVTAAFIAFLALMGYVFDIAFFFRVSVYSGMALHTAVTFLILCAGLLFLYPERGLLFLVTTRNWGGMLARRLLLLAMIVPLLTAWIAYLGQRSGLYDSGFLPILLTVLNVYAYSAVVYWFTRSLSKVDSAHKQAEDRFRAVVEASPDALILFDRHGRICLMNRQAESLFGYQREELLNQPVERLMPTHLHAAHEEQRTAFFATLSARPMGTGRDLFGLHKSGREIPVEIGLNPIVIHQESFVLAAIVDITERQKTAHEMAESRRWLERVAATTPDILFIFDIVSKRNVYSNRSVLDVLGYTPEEMARLPNVLEAIVDAADLPQTQAFYEEMANVEAGDVRVLNHRLVHKDGTIRWIESRIAPFQWDSHGTLTQVIGIARDITDRKRAEERARSYAAQLERSNRDLQDFAYVASHDLQEPLRKIIAFGDRLSSRYADVLDEKGIDYLERMQNASRRMQTLIQNLLAFSRIESGGDNWQHVDLNEVVREVIADLEQSIQQSNGQLHVDTLPVLIADRTQMRQVLQNLISNALKFHQPERPPLVHIYQISEGLPPHQVAFAVADNGIGIEMQYAERIFKPFQRLHGRTDYEGTGIGLSICRRIIDRHQGDITLTSTPGEGSTFIITLPADQKQHK